MIPSRQWIQSLAQLLILASSMWLKSEEDCFVTVQDTLKYFRNCELQTLLLTRL